MPPTMNLSIRSDNPLASSSMQVWDDLVEAMNPASLLVLIERRMSTSLKAQHSAEDIFQDALMHAWRDRHQCQWNGLRQFRSWLISIIDHRIHDAADHAGRQKRGGALRHHSLAGGEQGDSRFDAPMVTTTPSRIAMYKEQASAMQEALATLPVDLADVVRLRLFEQLPLDSIAIHLGIGLAAVRHRFRKGVALYQSRLQAAIISRSGLPSKEIAPPGAENASFQQ
jgi:RNA polymerase sigma factor (sigma-70 family)